MGVQRGLYSSPEAQELVGLIVRYGDGDRQAGEILQGIVRGVLARRVRRCDITPQEAEELVQESILQVFSRLEEYNEDKGNFDAWVTGFAMNSIRSHRRRESKMRKSSVPVDESFELSYEISVADGEQELLNDALNSLDPLDKELLHMRFSLGMSSDEIAEHSDLNAPQVRKRISRAVERLRRHPSVRQVLA